MTRPPDRRVLLAESRSSYAGRVNTPRVMAIDWSGRSGADQRRVLWLAEAIDGGLLRLEDGRTRAELVELLIAEADRDPSLIVGFDFAFSLPAWYLQVRRLTPSQLWALIADEALTPTMQRYGLARWMNAPEAPFWTISQDHARLRPQQMFRRTEQDMRLPGVQPKSVFQLIGAGQVGRGSLYGMQALHRLTGAGFQVWPFDRPALPVVVEIYPRVLTGPVRKNSRSERERYLEAVPLPPDLRRLAASSEDAFDAAVSAVVMAARVEELKALPEEPGYAIEGKIWAPHDRAAVGTAGRQPAGRHGELGSAVARVILEAAARGESATAQADKVLDMLNRRGLLGGRLDRPVG